MRWRQRIVAAFDERTNSAALKTLQIIISKTDDLNHLKFVQGILSSKLINFYCVNYLLDDLNQTYLERIPIPVMFQNSSILIDLVDQIVAMKKMNPEADTTKIEENVDDLVYQLYDLDRNEIKLIEQQDYT